MPQRASRHEFFPCYESHWDDRRHIATILLDASHLCFSKRGVPVINDLFCEQGHFYVRTIPCYSICKAGVASPVSVDWEIVFTSGFFLCTHLISGIRASASSYNQ